MKLGTSIPVPSIFRGEVMFVSCSFQGGFLGLQTENSMLGIQQLGHSLGFGSNHQILWCEPGHPGWVPWPKKKNANRSTSQKKTKEILERSWGWWYFRFRGYSSYVPPDIISTHKGGYHLPKISTHSSSIHTLFLNSWRETDGIYI